MIRGIGVDTVSISAFSELMERMTEGALARMFTKGELTASRSKSYPASYLAARFAVKEATFKAVAPNLREKSFDYRRIETRNNRDGSPYIQENEFFRPLLKQAGIKRLFVSITTENDLATAFVVAES